MNKLDKRAGWTYKTSNPDSELEPAVHIKTKLRITVNQCFLMNGLTLHTNK